MTPDKGTRVETLEEKGSCNRSSKKGSSLGFNRVRNSMKEGKRMLDTQSIQAIQCIVGEKNLLYDPARIKAYNCDAYTAEKAEPTAVVFPETTEQVSLLVQYCYQHGIAFLPRGAGTGLSGGATPTHHEVIISLVKMDKILSIDYENHRAVVQPGFVNLHLTQKIASHGFYYAPDPSSQSVCTIGGNVAENSGGSHCLKYGVTTNHVVAVKCVLPTGRIVELGENFGDAVGYDLLGVVVGSEGTLGIVTEITVKILKKPESVKTLLALFDRVEDASDTVSALIRHGIIPAACEMMDKLTLYAVDKSHYHVGYPSDIEAVLLIEVDGLEAGVDDVAAEVMNVCTAHHVRTVKLAANDAERDLWWKSRKMAFPAIGRISNDYLVQDGVIPRSQLTHVLETIVTLSQQFGLRVANVFHAGDGNLHPLICYDARNPEELARAVMLGQQILELCVDVGGSITGEHGVGIEKIQQMAYMYNELDLDAQSRLRQIFDPLGLCNPGKILPTPQSCGDRPTRHGVVSIPSSL